jgi:hypothetical protein
MNTTGQKSNWASSENWQHFLWLVFANLVAYMIATLVLPVFFFSVRADWPMPSFLIPVCIGLVVITFRLFQKQGVVFKAQAIILWTLSGAMLVSAILEYFDWLLIRGFAH